MGIALLAASAFVHPLHALGLWWRRQRTHAAAPACRAAGPSVARHAPHPGAALRHAAGTTVSDAATAAEKRAQPCATAASESARAALPASVVRATGPHRAVRVLRRSGTGGTDRLVISGRMADVCAELDRLAAREMLH
ncbi:hypothetical protein B2J88_38955 [Rhodococcus sp. SRB_17]|nr:hypothetical protein [Rhodococcus sp. SRB_17]